MENLDKILRSPNPGGNDYLNGLITKLYAVEAANSAILINQARILAALENRPTEELMQEVTEEYQNQIKQKQKEYSDWLSKFL